MSISVKEAEDISALARQKGLYLGINHNMMFFSAYQQLRRVVRSGVLGPIDNIGINYFSELEQIRFGPFESWMLRVVFDAIPTSYRSLSPEITVLTKRRRIARRAGQSKSRGGKSMIRLEPAFLMLRSDPRFQSLWQRTGFPGTPRPRG